MKRTVKLLGLLLVVAMVISSMAIFVACDNTPTTKEYTVTFYDGANVLKTENVKEGEKVASWTPSKDGYIFEGWYATPNFSHKFDFDSAISENKSVYAQWSSAQQSADTREFYILGSGTSKILAASSWGKGVFDDTMKMTKAADKNEYTYTVDLQKGDEFQFAIDKDWRNQRGFGYLKSLTLEDGTEVFSGAATIGENAAYRMNIKCELAGNYTFTLTTHPDDDTYETNNSSYSEADKEKFNINSLDSITWVRNGDVVDGGEEEVVIEAFAIKGSKVTGWLDSTEEEHLLKKNVEGKYVLTIQLYANDEFMFVAYKDVDGTLTALPIYIKSDMIADGSASEVSAKAGGNFTTSADGTYMFTYDHETTKVSIAYSSEFSLGAEERPTTWYILGNSTTDGVLKTSSWNLNDETAQGLASKGNGVYEITLNLYAGDQFKICSDGSWANAHAFESIVEPGENFISKGNVEVVVEGNYTLTLTIDAEDETKDTIVWVRNGDCK